MKKPSYQELEREIEELKNALADSQNLQKALETSEEKYKTLTENIKIGVFRSTPGSEGRFLEINNTMVNMLGYQDKQEIVANPVSFIYQNPEDRERYSAKLVSDGFVTNEELLLKKKDGTPIIVSETAIGVKDEEGELVCFVGIAEDITQRKATEKKIRLQSAYYRELIQSAPEAIVLHDNEDRIVTINKEFTRLFGYSLEEVKDRQINEIIASRELMDEAKSLSGKVLKGERVSVETKRCRKDKSLVDVSILGAPVFFDNKQIGVYAIYRDISVRKRAEEKLQIQSSYLEKLFNSTLEAIVLHDNQDIVVKINAQFTKLFGYSPREAIGKPINDLIATRDLQANARDNSAKVLRGDDLEVETKRQRKDGTRIDVKILGAPIFNNRKQIGVYAIYRDISEQKKAEEDRIKAIEQARMARNIQENLLPKAFPKLRGYDLAGFNIPALDVGGDYFDFIQIDPRHLALCLGDVSGKGLGASLIMANLQATIRGQAFLYSSGKKCIERANRQIFHSTDRKTFISFFYGILNKERHLLVYTNAGHNMPVIIPSEGGPHRLKTRGMALGIKEITSYKKAEVGINPGDILLIYSDGISEAMDEQMEEFGEERMIDVVMQNRQKSSEEIIQKIISRVKLHFGNLPQNDDMTIIVLKRNF